MSDKDTVWRSRPRLRCGFIGLGIMGKPMATNLLNAGFPLTVYNRTAAKAHAFAERCGTAAPGCDVVRSPKEVAEKSDVVIAIVTDTPDVEEVLFAPNGVAAGARAGLVFVDMSTIRPDATRRFAARLGKMGVDYLDAPVSGGDIGAIKATLTIMVGGEKTVFDRVLPVFQALGKRVTHVGPAGAGQMVKACNQVLCAVNMMGVCEALSLGAAAGINLDTMLDVLTAGAANSWALENLGRKIVRGDLNPGFMVKLIQKDLNIVMDAAREANLPLPGTALAMQNYRAVQAAGGGDLGTQAMITTYERLANRKVRP